VAQRRHQEVGIVGQGGDDLIDHLGLDQRLVTLHVDDDVAGELRRDFGDAVGAGAMIRPCHPGLAAERLDGPDNAFVVGGDEHAIDRPRPRRSQINVLDHRPAGDQGQRLTGEARRLEASRDDGDCGGMLRGRNREHDES
jgi:hypothetical protein